MNEIAQAILDPRKPVGIDRDHELGRRRERARRHRNRHLGGAVGDPVRYALNLYRRGLQHRELELDRVALVVHLHREPQDRLPGVGGR